jgi:hypothetical protein
MWNRLLVTYLTADAGTGDSGIPNGPVKAPPGLADLTNTVIGWIKWGVLAAGVIGILICAFMIIAGRRDRHRMAIEGLVGGAWVLGGLAMASVAAVLVGAFKL